MKQSRPDLIHPPATDMSAFCDRKVFCYKGFKATGCGTDNVKCVAMSDEEKNMMLEVGGRRKLTRRIKSKKIENPNVV